MKKIFTLISMALMAVGANAQGSWVAPETAPAAGMSIIKDDLMKVETVFETTCGKILDASKHPAPVTFAGKTFETDMQIRVDAAPTNDAPTGTEKSGSTPLVITAKKNVDLTIYYRRQAVDGAYSENDGKDIKLVEQTKATTAIKSASYEATDIDGEYGNVKRVYNLEEGKTYTLFAKGTTGRLYGMDYAEGTGSSEQGGSGSGSSEELSTGGTKDTDYVGKSYTIPGTYIAGAGSAKVGDMSGSGIKLRTNKGENEIVFNVNSGYAITSFTLIGAGNNSAGNISAIKATVDGGENLLASAVSFENGGKEASNSSKIELTNIKAQSNITIGFEYSADFDGNKQINCTLIVTYTDATGVKVVKTETIDANAPAYNLAGQKVDSSFKGIIIKNGKKMIQK